MTGGAHRPRRRVWPWLILAFAFMLTVFYMFTDGEAVPRGATGVASPAAPTTATITAGPGVVPQGPPQTINVDIYSQGSWDVGTDEGQIRPGRYRTEGAPKDSIFPFCVAQKMDFEGRPQGMPITTNNGPAFFTVRSEDNSVTFSGDCEWAAFRK